MIATTPVSTTYRPLGHTATTCSHTGIPVLFRAALRTALHEVHSPAHRKTTSFRRAGCERCKDGVSSCYIETTSNRGSDCAEYGAALRFIGEIPKNNNLRYVFIVDPT